MPRKRSDLWYGAVALAGLAGAICATVLATVLGSGVAPAQEPITLKILRPWPAESKDCTGYREFIKTVNEKGKGKVKLTDVGGSEVFPSGQQLSVLKGGQVDLLYTASGYIASSFPEPTALMYQFGASPTQVREAGVIDKLDAIGRQTNGVAFLGIPWWANAHVWLKKPVSSLDDLKKLKIRSHPGYDPLIKGLGVATVNVSFSDLFTALDRGVIDGFAFPYFDVKTYGLEKVVRYRVDPPFWRAGWVMLLANARKLDSLPADVRKLIFDATLEIEKKAPEIYDALAEEESKELAAAGVKSTRLSEEEWRAAQRVAWEVGLQTTLLKVSEKYGKEVVDMMGRFYPPKAPFKAVGLQ